MGVSYNRAPLRMIDYLVASVQTGGPNFRTPTSGCSQSGAGAQRHRRLGGVHVLCRLHGLLCTGGGTGRSARGSELTRAASSMNLLFKDQPRLGMERLLWTTHAHRLFADPSRLQSRALARTLGSERAGQGTQWARNARCKGCAAQC